MAIYLCYNISELCHPFSSVSQFSLWMAQVSYQPRAIMQTDFSDNLMLIKQEVAGILDVSAWHMHISLEINFTIDIYQVSRVSVLPIT